MIVYGVKGYVSSVEPKVYDTAFVVENGKMVMETDLDLNGYSLNASFFMTGYFNKTKSLDYVFLNDVSVYQIIPYDCVLKEIVCHFPPHRSNDFRITLRLRSQNNDQRLNSTSNERMQVLTSGINLTKNDLLRIDIFKINTSVEIIPDYAIFCLKFTLR